MSDATKDYILFNGKKLYWKGSAKGTKKIINKYIWSYAVSGLKKHNPALKRLIKEGRTDIKPDTDYSDSKFQNLSGAGPIPEGTYTLAVNATMKFEKSGGGWGVGGWAIYPENGLVRRLGFLEGYMDSDLPWVRSGFFLHEDGSRDGTAGCIGLSKAGILNIKKYLKSYSGSGEKNIKIVVDYTKVTE